MTTGIRNVIMGAFAGDALTTGQYNIAIGYSALSSEDAHGRNVAIGLSALATQNAGADAYNIAIGYNAGGLVTTGVKNVIMGGLAGDAMTDANQNVAIGYTAMTNNQFGHNSVAVGAGALFTMAPSDGSDFVYNTAFGYNSGHAITTGANNTILGGQAGDALTTGDNNIIIGKAAAASAVDVDNTTVLGTTATLDAKVHGLCKPVISANANIAAAAAFPNSIFVFGDADGATVTLPDSGDGSQIGKTFEFVVTVTATSNAHKVVFTDTTNEKIYGQVVAVDTDTSDGDAVFAAQAGDNFSALSLNGTTTGIIGSRFTLTNVAADVWFAEGFIHHTGDAATPFATS
jgi:hypothetical protein